MQEIKSDKIIERLLQEKCRALERELSGEAILMRVPMAMGIDDIVRREVDGLAAEKGRNQRLIVVLETEGGSVEAVERINGVFRHHFREVFFVIPNCAYSAGTVLTLSGDAIYMDYYSVLGPIDPQIRNREGRWVPGLGYLEKYNDLIRRSASGDITGAELEFLIRKFDPAELFALERAKRHSEDLICEWLPRYKFKNWRKTASSGKKVTPKMRRDRANEIAQLLGDATEWNSHGRGIPLRTLQSDRIKLEIEDYGKNESLQDVIRQYYDLFIDYCGKRSCDYAIHTKQRLLLLGRGS